MLPPVTLGALLIVLALVPGWLYLRLVERLRPPATYGGLHQLLEVLAVGAATSGVAALAVLLTPHRLLPFTLNIDAWAAGGVAYLRAHPRPAAWSVALVFVLALLVAYGLFSVHRLRRPAEFRGHGNVWVHSLGNRPADKVPYVGLHLDDGRLVEGKLHSYALDTQEGCRDLALERPIRITQANETVAHPLPNLDRLVVSADRISFITVIHAPRQMRVRKRRRAERAVSPDQRKPEGHALSAADSSAP